MCLILVEKVFGVIKICFDPKHVLLLILLQWSGVKIC